MIWYEYEKDTVLDINMTNPEARLLIPKLGNLKDDFFECKTAKQMSTWIKDFFHVLGEELGYKVYGHGISPELKKAGYFKSREWLYDLHWYTEPENTHYIPKTIPLVLECEWNNKQPGNKETRYGAVMFDFQKLLVTNAPLRVMIFKIAQKSDLDYLSVYFGDGNPCI